MNKTIFVMGIVFVLVGCGQKAPQYKQTSKHTVSKKACMRQYTVKGKKYTPTYVSIGDTMKGISSWYGKDFHGKHTSSGEIYNMYKRTAAHKTWPMNTMVKVTNLDNGKSTVVRINDRGPFVKGRVIDCSYLAGKELGLDKSGLAPVRLEVVGFSGKVDSKRTTYHYKPTSIKLSNFGVQVGAFTRYSGAKVTQQKYNRMYPNHKTIIKRFGNLYRVWMMGFGSEAEAREFRDCSVPGGFIVRP